MEVLINSSSYVGGFIGSSAMSIMALAEEHPLKITAEASGNKAVIKISGIIHAYNNSAAWFSAKVDSLIADGINDVHVILTTPGGDVFQANQIANEIEKFPGTITGESGAIVGSAGTYIAVSFSSFEMPENAQFMYHKPSAHISGNEDTVESTLKVLKNFTADYKARYADKSKLTEDQIETNWSKGDVWLTAKEALKQGFISGIIPRSKITSQDEILIAACGAPNQYKASEDPVPNEETKTDTDTEMKDATLKMTALKLGLPETATQAEVDAKLIELQDKANKADAFEANAEQAEKDRQKQANADMFAQAIKDKKITAEQAKNMASWAEKDPKGCKEYIDKLTALVKPTAESSASATGSPSITGKKFEDLTEAEAEALEVSDPETFNALYDAYLDQ